MTPNQLGQTLAADVVPPPLYGPHLDTPSISPAPVHHLQESTAGQANALLGVNGLPATTDRMYPPAEQTTIAPPSNQQQINQLHLQLQQTQGPEAPSMPQPFVPTGLSSTEHLPTTPAQHGVQNTISGNATESASSGALTAGAGTMATLSLAGYPVILAATGLMNLPLAAGMAGVPLLTAWAGKKLLWKNHPVASAITGAAVGAAGMTIGAGSALSLSIPGLSAIGGGSLGGLSVLGSASLTALPALVGSGLYLAGRAEGNIRGKPPAGIIETMGRGVRSVATIPLHYLTGGK